MTKTEIAHLSVCENRLINIRILHGKDINPDALREVFRVMNDLSRGEDYAAIIDARDVEIGYIYPETFQLNSLNSETPNKKAEAYIANGLPIRLIVNFYLRFYKPVIPVKLFNDPAEAKEWLRKILDESNSAKDGNRK